MQLRRKLEAKIVDKIKEIDKLQLSIAQAEAYLEGLQDTLKMFPAEGVSLAISVPSLRAGSDLARVREILLKYGKSMHINEIIISLGKEITRNTKGALAGSLGAYVRKHEIFTRTGPNLFGLIEFGGKEVHFAPDEQVEELPPDDFGIGAPTSCQVE